MNHVWAWLQVKDEMPRWFYLYLLFMGAVNSMRLSHVERTKADK